MKRVTLCLCVLPVTLRSLHEKVEDGKGQGVIPSLNAMKPILSNRGNVDKYLAGQLRFL